jgi:hypothetical protein
LDAFDWLTNQSFRKQFEMQAQTVADMFDSPSDEVFNRSSCVVSVASARRFKADEAMSASDELPPLAFLALAIASSTG